MKQADPDAENSTATLWVVTSCMGRLSFLRQTASRVLAHPRVRYCLVDYSCPDDCGDWMTKTFQDNISRGQCVVERVTEQRIFNKCKAYNAGARRALREGAQFLCFLDADTLVASNFFDWLLPRLHNGCFFITALRPNGRDVSDLTGLLALSASDFARSQGFDEAFRGWGSEDIEMRLRLHVLYGLSYADVPLSLIRPIRHDNRLRSLHYVEKDIFRSDQHNFARMLRKLAAWRSKSRSTLGSIDRLLYHTARNAYVPTQPSAQAPLSCMASAQPTMLDGTSK